MRPCEVTHVFYHGNCLDGALGAVVLKLASQLSCCEVVPMWWTELPKCGTPLAGAKVVFVDITPAREVLENVLRSAAAVTVLDHHESARELLAALTRQTWPATLAVHFDVLESGCTLAWKWCHSVERGEDAPPRVRSGRPPMPALCRYIKALDMFDWTDLLPEDASAVHVSRAIEQLLSPTVQEVEDALRRGQSYIDFVRAGLPYVNRVVEQNIDRALSSAEVLTLAAHPARRAVVVNAQNFVNFLAHKSYMVRYPGLLVWVWYRHGPSGKLRVMLRSGAEGSCAAVDGEQLPPAAPFDCQAYARRHGGGGHRASATFSCDHDDDMWSHFVWPKPALAAPEMATPAPSPAPSSVSSPPPTSSPLPHAEPASASLAAVEKPAFDGLSAALTPPASTSSLPGYATYARATTRGTCTGQKQPATTSRLSAHARAFPLYRRAATSDARFK